MPMKNNNERFTLAPLAGHPESSTWHDYDNVKLTCDAGKLIPFKVKELFPGDLFEFSENDLVRGQTPKFPTMDNAYMDVFYFAIPWRLVWDGTKQFFKENNTSTPWVISPVNEKFIPSIEIPVGGFSPCSPADYLGIPTGVGAGVDVNAMPFRCYGLIYNEWFRDENLQAAVPVSHGDTGTSDDLSLAKNLLPVAKLRDRFTTALPSPQRGPSVLVPVGTTAPVETYNWSGDLPDHGWPLEFVSDKQPGDNRHMNFDFATINDAEEVAFAHATEDGYQNLREDERATVNVYQPLNLRANLAAATGATISQLRQAFAFQRIWERFARGGSRYNEMVKSFFDVDVPDARVQRTELIGKYRVDLNTREVIQTSGQIEDGTPAGNTSGYLRAFSERHRFGSYAATEHTFVMCCLCIRTDMTYSQGLDRLWSYHSFEDLYLPALAHISEQPVYMRELYLSADEVANKAVFGYQEPFYWLRGSVPHLAGGFKRGGSNYLDAWHYGHKFGSAPTLSSEFINSSAGADIGKTLAVTLENTGEQFIIDIYTDWLESRPMPLYSVPGMIDHY